MTGDDDTGTITYTGSGITPLYLTVKIGNTGFNLYQFNAGTISFSREFFTGANGFSQGVYYDGDYWAKNGPTTSQKGISHVTVWGQVGHVIPEPGSLLVWFASMGCVGLVGLRRRRG